MVSLVNLNDIVIYLAGPGFERWITLSNGLNHYPADSVVCFVYSYPLDGDLSGPGCSKAG